MKVCQVTVIRLLGSLGPVDHQPELLQLAMGFFESASKINLLPSDAGMLSCALGGFPATMLPLRCGQRACDIQEIACTLGRLLVHCAVFAFEGGGHFLSPASVFLRGDLQEELHFEFPESCPESKTVAIGRVAQHWSREHLIGKRLLDQSQGDLNFWRRSLYLPQSWLEDPKRCAKAGVPPDVGFATKSEIALTLIEQALADQVLPAPVLGDSAYGDGFAFRARLRELKMEFFLQVTPEEHRGWIEEVSTTLKGKYRTVDEKTAQTPRNLLEVARSMPAAQVHHCC